jgi:hypothetical protein
MSALLDETLCYCTGDTIRDACRMALGNELAAGSIGNFCTGCRDDFKLLWRVVQEDPGCAESADALLRAIHERAGRLTGDRR